MRTCTMQSVLHSLVDKMCWHIPMESTAHASGKLSLISAEASRGSSPPTVTTEVEDMVV